MFGNKAETYLNLVEQNETHFFLVRESRNIPKLGLESQSMPKFDQEKQNMPIFGRESRYIQFEQFDPGQNMGSTNSALLQTESFYFSLQPNQNMHETKFWRSNFHSIHVLIVSLVFNRLQ